MLSKNQKRIIVIIISFLVSSFIWYLNKSWGNDFRSLLISSILTFLTVFVPFEIYFSFRDIWVDRWIPLYLENIEIIKIKINVDGGFLYADLIKSKDKQAIKSRNALIVISHGFSDTKETLQYYSFPLAYQGYIILAYDSRGTGESKKTGRKSQFLKRIEDFKKIIEWIKTKNEFLGMKINCIGFSIGAITTLCGGFSDKSINKIIVISSMSYYKQNIPKYNPLIMLRYFMKGVKLFPNKEENNKLSPCFIINSAKKDLSEEEWKRFSRRVMLIHCKNDKVIKFKNFEENRIILESPEKNLLILKKGGHSQKKNECSLIGATLSFLNS